MRDAIAMAQRLGGDKRVDYINTHGTSTPVGDVKELGAIKELFDNEFDYCPNIGSTKSLSGHALSVAGVHEAIYSLLMMDRGFLAESANIVDVRVESTPGGPGFAPAFKARHEQSNAAKRVESALRLSEFGRARR